MSEQTTQSITPDALSGHWTNTRLPEAWRPYARLARWDRPIGWWLLLWPCWFSAGLAALAAGESMPNFWHMFLFFVGAVAMRGAGCTYNDIVDRKIDAQVERTKNRPLPAGEVTVRNAKIFMVAQSLTGFVVLIQFNWFSIWLGICSLAVVAIYPFMKRITSWPQFVLGLAFNWGALMGWAAVFGRIDTPAILVYLGGVAWTIAYDTIYAHQDQTDDAIIGVKSTARLFGRATKPLISLFFVIALGCFAVAGALASPDGSTRVLVLIAMLAPTAHALWQLWTFDPDQNETCLRAFRSNKYFGLLVFGAFAGPALIASL
ncbi:MAG: 4-hydroxybenzoate octaprenyltransferase [Pseudomonadota bacterium]